MKLQFTYLSWRLWGPNRSYTWTIVQSLALLVFWYKYHTFVTVCTWRYIVTKVQYLYTLNKIVSVDFNSFCQIAGLGHSILATVDMLTVPSKKHRIVTHICTQALTSTLTSWVQNLHQADYVQTPNWCLICRVTHDFLFMPCQSQHLEHLCLHFCASGAGPTCYSHMCKVPDS